MNRVLMWLLLASIALIVIGIVFRSSAPVSIPSGLGLLVVGFILEKIRLRGTRHRTEDLASRSRLIGMISAQNSKLIVSAKWTFDESLELDGFDGSFQATISERWKGDFSLISGIKLANDAPSTGEARSVTESISVDGGWVMLLASNAAKDFEPKALKKIIQSELRSLPDEKPLCLWLRNNRSEPVGLVVSTGEGDGTYEVKYASKGEKLVTIEAKFLSEAKVSHA